MASAPSSPRPAAAPPLTLGELLAGVNTAHPAVLAARMQTQAAQQEVGAAERLRWPTLSVVAEAGATSGSDAANPSRAFRLEQTLWDFGRVDNKIDESRALAEVAAQQADETRMELSLQVVNTWQQLLAGVEREWVASRSLRVLQGFQDQMRRRVAAQASAAIDQELVDARVLQTEVDLTSARTQVLQAALRLEQLSGLPDLVGRLSQRRPASALNLVESFHTTLTGVDWPALARSHASVQRAERERLVLEQRLELKQSELKPQLYFRLDQPLGRSSGVTSTSPRYFVGVRYTPDAGLANHVLADALSTRLQGQTMSIEAAEREVLQALLNDREDFNNARTRLPGLERSVQGAKVVMESYLRQFQAGRKSWLDLLNTVRELSNNEYALAEAQTAMLGAMHRLRLRMGLPAESH